MMKRFRVERFPFVVRQQVKFFGTIVAALLLMLSLLNLSNKDPPVVVIVRCDVDKSGDGNRSHLMEFGVLVNNDSRMWCKIPLISFHTPFPGSDFSGLKMFTKDSPPQFLECERVHLYDDVSRLEDGMIVVNGTKVRQMELHFGSKLRCWHRTFGYSADRKDLSLGPWKPLAIWNRTRPSTDYTHVVCELGDKRPAYDNIHLGLNFVSNKSKKRRKIDKRNPSFNVAVLILESLSFPSFQRLAPRTYAYLHDELGALEFRGYHKVGDNSNPNVFPILSGYRLSKMQEDMPDEFEAKFTQTDFAKWKLITDTYFNDGYFTYLGGEERPNWSLNSWHQHGLNFKNLDFSWWPVNKIHMDVMRVNGSSEFCFGNVPFHQIVMNHIFDFTFAARDFAQFLFYFFSYLNHDDEDELRKADMDFLRMFRMWRENGYLDDTVLFVMSDHGPRFNAQSRARDLFGYFEQRLPLAMAVVPKRFRTAFPDFYANLVTNQRRLLSHFDLHKTLLHLLPENLNNPEKFAEASRNFSHGQSLFFEAPLERTCVDANIPSTYCACDQMTPLDRKGHVVTKAANALVEGINAILDVDAAMNCSIVELNRIEDAFAFSNGDLEKRQGDPARIRFLSITVETLPGRALFRAKIRQLKKDEEPSTFAVVGDIARLNRYGNQSACVEETEEAAVLKKYCYCLSETPMKGRVPAPPDPADSDRSSNNSADERRKIRVVVV